MHANGDWMCLGGTDCGGTRDSQVPDGTRPPGSRWQFPGRPLWRLG